MAFKAYVLFILLVSSHGNPVNESPTTYQDFESNHIGSPTPSPYPHYTSAAPNPPPNFYTSRLPPVRNSVEILNSPPTSPYSTLATNPPPSQSPSSTTTADHEDETHNPIVSPNPNSIPPGSIVFIISAPQTRSPLPRFPFGRSPLGFASQRFPFMSQRFPLLNRRQGLGPPAPANGYIANISNLNVPYSIPASSNVPISISYNPNVPPGLTANTLTQQNMAIPYSLHVQQYPYANNVAPIVAPIVWEPIRLDLNKSTPFEYKFECRPNCLRIRSILPLSLNFRIGCYPIRICQRLLLIHSREPIRNANLLRAGIRAGSIARNRQGQLLAVMRPAGELPLPPR